MCDPEILAALLDDATAILARKYPDIEDGDAICADCFASVHVRDGAEWTNGLDVCDQCASDRLTRTERVLREMIEAIRASGGSNGP